MAESNGVPAYSVGGRCNRGYLLYVTRGVGSCVSWGTDTVRMAISGVSVGRTCVSRETDHSRKSVKSTLNGCRNGRTILGPFRSNENRIYRLMRERIRKVGLQDYCLAGTEA